MLTALRRHLFWLLVPLLLGPSLAALAWARHASPGALGGRSATRSAAASAGEAAAPQPAYRLELRGWEGPVSEEGYLLVVVEALAPYKINTDYPQRLRLGEPSAGLELPLRELRLSDARLDDKRRLTFTLPVIARRAGQYTVRAALRLSVCSQQQCRSDKRDIELGVVAQ